MGERFKAYRTMDSFKYFAIGFVSKVGGRRQGNYFVPGSWQCSSGCLAFMLVYCYFLQHNNKGQ